MGEQEWKPLAKCRVLYIGSAISPPGHTSMDAIQQPLNERLPPDVSNVQGIDAWLYAQNQGLQMQFIHDNNVVFFPLNQLYVCAAVRRKDDYSFTRLDDPQVGSAIGPPVFALVMKRDNNIKECHGFICKSDQSALALVQSCQVAHNQQMRSVSDTSSSSISSSSASTLPQQPQPVQQVIQQQQQPVQVLYQSSQPQVVYQTEQPQVIYQQQQPPAPQVVYQTDVQQPGTLIRQHTPQVIQGHPALPPLPAGPTQGSVPEHGYFYTADEGLIKNYNLAGPPKIKPKRGITVENIQTEHMVPARYEPLPTYIPQQQPQQQVFQIELPVQQETPMPQPMTIEAPPPRPAPIQRPAPAAAPIQPVFIVPPPPASQRMVVEEWRTVSSSSSSSSSDHHDMRDEIGEIVEEVMRRRADKKRGSRGMSRESETVYRTAPGYGSRHTDRSGGGRGVGLPRYDRDGRGSYQGASQHRSTGGGHYGFRSSNSRVY